MSFSLNEADWLVNGRAHCPHATSCDGRIIDKLGRRMPDGSSRRQSSPQARYLSYVLLFDRPGLWQHVALALPVSILLESTNPMRATQQHDLTEVAQALFDESRDAH